MSTSPELSFSSAVRLCLTVALTFALTAGTGRMALAAGPAPVDLGAAAPFVILTKTGITNVPTSAITGKLGVSPISSTAITGFSLVLDATGKFSRSSQVTGKLYAADYADPTPANLTTAVGDMETAYTDAAGRSLPDFTELYAGDLSGRTLAPGLYKWSTGVLVTTQVTLAGGGEAVWIFQIAEDLTIGPGADILLSGGAQARNIFWQVGGGTGVEIGTTAHVEGTILAQKAIHLRTGASLNGRALAQTAVTLEQNAIELPPLSMYMTFTSRGVFDGFVRETAEDSGKGGVVNSTAAAFRLGDDPANRQYRAILHFDTSGLPNRAVITEGTLTIMKQGVAGTDPFGTHGRLQTDIRTPYFGPTAGLTGRDFQAAAGAAGVGAFDPTPVGDRYAATLTATGRSLVNLTGTTQFRLSFETDDDNDLVADFVKFYSGDAAT
jgi:hypothetical protein